MENKAIEIQIESNMIQDYLPVLSGLEAESIQKSDPMTVITVIKTVVDIANDVADLALKIKSLFSDDSNLDEIVGMLNNINKKLGLLLDGQLIILDAIKELRFTFRDELERSEIQKLHLETQAWIFTLNINMARLKDAQSQSDVNDIVKSIEQLLHGAAGQQLFLPTFWGPGGFSTAAISYSAWLQTGLLTNQPDSYLVYGLNQFESSFNQALKNAIDVNKQVLETKKQVEEDIDKRLQVKKILIKRKVDTSSSGYDRCVGKNVTNTFLIIKGDLSKGFTGNIITEKGQWNLQCRTYEGGGSNRYKSQNEIANELTIGLEDFEKDLNNQKADHKGIIAQLNQQRSNIIKMTVQLNTVRLLKLEIGRLNESITVVRKVIKA